MHPSWVNHIAAKSGQLLKLAGCVDCRGKLRSRGNSSVIVTNELDLDDLDDVESVCGFGLINATDHQPNHSSSVSGFDEHAEWPSDLHDQGKAQVLSGLPPQAQFSNNPFSNAGDKPKVRKIKQKPTNHCGEQNAARQAGSWPQIQIAPPETNATPIQSQKSEIIKKGKNPIDELNNNFTFDFLSGPLASVQDQAALPQGSPLKDPFSDLEPLEPLMVQAFPPKKDLAIGPVIPVQATTFQSDVYSPEPESISVLKLSNDKPEYPSRHMGSFIGEGGTSGRKNLPPVRTGFKSSFSRQGHSTFEHEASPVLSMSPDEGLKHSARRSNADTTSSWNNPHSSFVDIDQILLQQIEKLEINGSHARGVQSGVLSGFLRKSSMKKSHTSMGSGL